MTGAKLIAAERKRQIKVEGWTPKHDDKHDDQSLLYAALCYEACGNWQAEHGTLPAMFILAFKIEPIGWPWPAPEFKLGPSAIRTYVKAGALFQAEADRLRRKSGLSMPPNVMLSESFRDRVAMKIDRLLGIKIKGDQPLHGKD